LSARVVAEPTHGVHDGRDETMATMNTRATCVFAVALAVAVSSPARAQSWPERVHVSVNGAFQATTNDFSDRFEFERNIETGSTEVDYRVQKGFIFDGGGGVRLWKNLAAGVAVSSFTREESAATRSNFPHPFFFEQPREVTGDATGVKRSETAVHIQAMYLVNPGGRLRFVLSGGPSFFSVEQDLVTEVTIAETFPFDAATFASAQKTREKGSAPAFNVGADVMWMLGRRFGVGGVIRFSRAAIDLDAPGGRTITVDAGGVYAGGGVRLLF
jgi:hypothetical protein